MKKKILLSVVILAIILPIRFVYAVDVIKYGTCGQYDIDTGEEDPVFFVVHDDGTMVINGNGGIGYGGDGTPWDDYKDSIHSISIAYGVTSIGSYAFQEMSNLTDISIPDGITSIGNGAFMGCTKIKNIELPQSLTKVGWNAFTNCKSLEYLSIPQNVEMLTWFPGDFDGMDSLKAIYVDKNNSDFFDDDGVLYDSDNDLRHYPLNKQEAEYKIADKTSYTVAFGDCKNLKRLEIPTSMQSVGSNAWKACSSLTDIYYNGSEEDWNNIENIGLAVNSNVTIHFNSSLPVLIVPVFEISYQNSSAEIINTDENESTAMIIIANYENSILKDISCSNETFAAGETKTYNFTGSGTHKVFVWNSLDGMVPLAK